MGDPTKQKKINSDNDNDTIIVMPIRVIQSIRILFEIEEEESKIESLVEKLALTPSPSKSSMSKLEALDRALEQETEEQSSTTQLVFTPPPEEPELTPARKKYLHRREKLKLLAEENKYNKITTNIQDSRQEDDITAKSMTYAASVGLNMIVAPISFGTFMFFFSGGVFDFFFPKADDYNTNRNTAHNPVDIKRVIIGVVSGVIMMIIEMVLFVIRTHEFDHYATKKKKARGVEPFGAYTSKSTKEYYEDENHNKINIINTNSDTVNTTSATSIVTTNDVVDKEKKNS